MRKSKVSALMVVSALVLALVYYLIPPISIGEMGISVKPVRLYLYIRINYIDILSNVPITSRIPRIELRILVYKYNAGRIAINRTLLYIDMISGHHEIGKEYYYDLNGSVDDRYLVKIVDNYTRVPIVLGPPAKYDTSLFTVYTSSYPCRINASYAVVGKGVRIETFKPIEAHILIVNEHLIHRRYSVIIHRVKTLDTDYYVRIGFYGYCTCGFLREYINGEGQVFFRPGDNPHILLIIEAAGLTILYAILTYHGAKSAKRRKRKKTGRKRS